MSIPIYSYCTSISCTCGQDCHENTDLHTQITGALTSDEWTEEIPLKFPKFDEFLFEIATASLSEGVM